MKSYVQDLMDELEAAGIIIKNGEMRFNSQGVLQPAYVIAPQYMNDPLALEKAFKAMSEFEVIENKSEQTE